MTSTPRRAKMPGPPAIQVPIHLRENSPTAAPRASTRWRPHPLVVIGGAIAIVTGTCFAIGYAVHGAKDAVVAAYASHHALIDQGYSVNQKESTPGKRQPTAAEKAIAQTPLQIKPNVSTPAKSAAATPPATKSGSVSAAANTPTISAKTVQIQPEKRKTGLFYFALAEYPAATAQRLVNYWKANGLDAELVSDDNTGLVLVVDLRGFTEAQTGTADFVLYENKLRDLGRKWKSQEKGPNALDHMNAAKFTGNPAAPKPAARLKKD